MYEESVSALGNPRPHPTQWETSLLSNAVSHWLGANLESALRKMFPCHGYIMLLEKTQGSRFNIKMSRPYRIPMSKIDGLAVLSFMAIPISAKDCLYFETGPPCRMSLAKTSLRHIENDISAHFKIIYALTMKCWGIAYMYFDSKWYSQITILLMSPRQFNCRGMLTFVARFFFHVRTTLVSFFANFGYSANKLLHDGSCCYTRCVHLSFPALQKSRTVALRLGIKLLGRRRICYQSDVGIQWKWQVRVGFRGTLLWCHNGRDGVSNHQPHNCLLNRSFRRRSTNTSKLRVTGLCAGNSPVTGEFPAQMASYAEMFPFDDVIMILFSLMEAICLIPPHALS